MYVRCRFKLWFGTVKPLLIKPADNRKKGLGVSTTASLKRKASRPLSTKLKEGSVCIRG